VSGSAADKGTAAADLLALYPKNLQFTFQGGATTSQPVAYTVPGCNAAGTRDPNVFVCSHVTAAGSNAGVEYPLWIAQSFMYTRFVQYDMRVTPGAPAGQFVFTDAGVDCTSL
jgi:hypothetical protein